MASSALLNSPVAVDSAPRMIMHGRGSRDWPTGRGSPVATGSCRGADADPAGPACTAPTGAAGTARMTSAAAPAAASQENRILIDVSRVRLRTESVSLRAGCCIKSTFTAKIRYSRCGQREELGACARRRALPPPCCRWHADHMDLTEKLQIKPGQSLAILNPPPGVTL